MKSTRSTIRLSITTAMLIFALTNAGPSWGLQIRVDAGVARERVSPNIFGNALIYSGSTMGFNEWVSSQQEYEAARRTWNGYLPLVHELGPTVLRYPHGLGANNFHWKAGIGPFAERNRHYDGIGIPQTFGTDEFLQYCEELGARANLVVNVSEGGKRAGSVQDAADWVEYCNAPHDGSNPGGGIDWAARRAANGHEEPYGVKYWELGNEETWPGFQDYARRVREYSYAMKAIDPTIRVGVIRAGSALDPIYDRDAWLDYHTLMLEEAGPAFDFWIHHAYPPGGSGLVDGFRLHDNGTSIEVDFHLASSGEYRVEHSVEGGCRWGLCPRLKLWIDGQERGNWVLPDAVQVLETPGFFLSAGRHSLRLEASNLSNDNRITICQQLFLYRQGEEEPLWIDLKDSLAFYHTMLGGWRVAEGSFLAGRPYTGGKPVFYTEANSQYQSTRSPPFIGKADSLREMLSLACLYHFFLRSGVELVNYWLLFQEQDGVGTIEGVAYDNMAGERARPDPHRRPSFHFLSAYRWNALDWVVPTEVTGSQTFLTGRQTGVTVGSAQESFTIPYVQALATVSNEGDELSLFVINLHPQQNLNAQIDLGRFLPGSPCRVLTITGDSPGTGNDPEECPAGNCVSTTETAHYFPGSRFSYSFPRHSVTVLRFHRSGSDQQAPRNPAGLRASAGDGRIQLFWDANADPDVDGYHLYRSRSPEGPFGFRVNATPIPGTEYLDNGVDNGVTYTYAVRAVDRVGNESGFSNRIRSKPVAGSGDPSGDPGPGDGGDNGGSPCAAGASRVEAATVRTLSTTGVSNPAAVFAGPVLILVGAIFVRAGRGSRKRRTPH